MVPNNIMILTVLMIIYIFGTKYMYCQISVQELSRLVGTLGRIYIYVWFAAIGSTCTHRPVAWGFYWGKGKHFVDYTQFSRSPHHMHPSPAGYMARTLCIFRFFSNPLYFNFLPLKWQRRFEMRVLFVLSFRGPDQH